MSLCSVIIVARHGGWRFFATIESVLSQKQLGELIIVDNGNAPDVISRLQQLSLSDPRLKMVQVRGDINFAKGCNVAARQATSEYLLLLKSGYLLPPDALQSLVSVLEKENKAMLSSGVVQNYDGSRHTLFRTHIITPKTTFFDIIGVNAWRRRRQSSYEKSTEQNIQQKPLFEVAAVSSACMCVRAGDYKKLGGLDEGFFPQDEELDFSLRVQQIGGRVLCLPSVKITRLPTGHDKRIPVAQQSREAKNIIRYLNKFFSAHQPIGTLFFLNILIMLRLTFKVISSGFLEFFQDTRSVPNNFAAKRLVLLALGSVDVPKTEQLAKRIVLVTGATSQTGLCVIRRLIASGAAVLAITKKDEIPFRHPSLLWMKKDLTSPTFSLDDYCVDAVVHCAPLWQLPPLLPIMHSAEAKRIIAFSSTLVFSKSLSANDFEKDFVTKLQNSESVLAEKCSAFGMRHTIFRPTQVYGVGLDLGITNIAKIIRRFGMMFVYPPAFGRRQPVHVDDLAMAVIKAMDNEITYDKSYNLSGGEVLTYREMLGKLFKLYKKKPKIINNTALPFILDVVGKISRKKHINGEIARRMNDDLVFFHDDAERDFGYHPRGFLTGGMKDIEGF
jgi:GT2 family glycosyltransferase/nucleoside-diphosphate-sugar epimerase